jgi:hypothetical protein
MIMTGGRLKHSEKNPSQCHFVHTNPIYTGMGSNLSFCDYRSVTNYMRHGTTNKPGKCKKMQGGNRMVNGSSKKSRH